MGTASSMGAICEALDLPGRFTAIPAGDPRHMESPAASGNASCRWSRPACRSRTSDSSVDRERVNRAGALGGSTNAVIHLTAMAHRLGLVLDLDAVDRVGRSVPVIVDVEPSGAALMEISMTPAGFPPSSVRSVTCSTRDDPRRRTFHGRGAVQRSRAHRRGTRSK